MEIRFIRHNTSRHLALIFAGWGMDHHPFATLAPDGYDTAVVWDYRDLSLPWLPEVSAYDEIAVMAWSFGVPAAARFIESHPTLPITARIAVNGTMHPVDDRLGIPQTIFTATLDSLDEKNLTRFYRRMCGGSSAFREFAATLPTRDIDGLRDELRAIASRQIPVTFRWDKAFVAASDLVIPTANQLRAWADDAYSTISIEGSHLPDFALLLSRSLTDKSLVEHKFRKASDSYEANATIQRDIVDRMLGKAGNAARILEIGSGTGYATSVLATKGETEAWDLTISPTVRMLAARGHIKAKACDAETEIRKVPSGSIGLLFSASTLQWFNSPSSFLREVDRVLAPGGTALISTFGPRTMEEIHGGLATSPYYPDSATLRRMAPGAEIEEEMLTIEFPTPAEALRHTKLTGVNALGILFTPAMTRRLLRNYPLTAGGKAPLTYQPIIITIRKQE